MSRRDRTAGTDEGWVLVTTLVLLGAMMTMAMALASIVDVQTGQSREQRVRDTAFNLAEAAMGAQMFSLARDWPGIGAALNPYPTCSTGVSSARCPADAQVTGGASTVDTTGASWQTLVRDNGAGTAERFYSDAINMSQPAYDANGDGQIWVRATATALGKRRTMVALVRAEHQEEEIPHGALLTGRLEISNSGNKTIIDASAGGAVPTAVVRCVPALLEATPCLGQRVGLGSIGSVSALLSFLGRQLNPNIVSTGYAGGAAMTVDARERLKATAIATGSYYQGCPASLTGAMVYIESGVCSYTGNAVYNTPQAPGMVVVGSGSLTLGGGTTYNGIVYHANLASSAATVVALQGNAAVIGGVLVDGSGVVVAGSSKLNIQLSPDAFRAVRSIGSAGVVQNTWRELTPA